MLSSLHLFIIPVMIISSMSVSVSAASTSSMNTTGSIAKQGCKSKCGSVTIPYPFGIGGPNCYHDKAFEITCGNDQVPFIKLSPVQAQVAELTLDYIRFMGWSLPNCYNKTSGKSEWLREPQPYLAEDSPFTFHLLNRHRLNKKESTFPRFHCQQEREQICPLIAYIPFKNTQDYASACSSFCKNSTIVYNLTSCSGGNGCCQTDIPKGLKSFLIQVQSVNTNNRSWTSNPCSQAVVVDKEFTGDIHGSLNPKGRTVLMILDWAIGNVSCQIAKRNAASYACKENSDCSEFFNGPGYRCTCKIGYTGNPYLGCQDIDKCKGSTLCHEGTTCINTPGSYLCSCPPGYHGDAKKLGGCIHHKQKLLLAWVAIIGIGIGFLMLTSITLGFWLWHRLEKRKQKIMKQRHFKRNGGLLLKQKISSNDGEIENASTIFLKEDLEKATDNFNQNRIIGKGGFGTVYKGMLSNGRIVAIKKSKLVDENQVDQFINEVVILSQINRRHIVKLLGCCLETEVPLLVYEFVSNGTLSYHPHGEGGHESSISWKDRLRIASEIAGALAYLHSDASIPIFHRYIKPDNILLDENFKSKVTLGYLDPEYYNSGQFTEKSDVYSFGVLLVELLTGQKALSNTRTEPNLAFHFLSTMKQKQLFTILVTRVVNEGDKDELNIKKRPIMKEVASCLDGLKKFQEPSSMVDDQEKCLAEQAGHEPISFTKYHIPLQIFCRGICEHNLLLTTQHVKQYKF
ncbi:hypothetical protein MKX01_020509 [Papaver californicum]|nr:hypothetical protein MKX01_020509 [Papaver californicum]